MSILVDKVLFSLKVEITSTASGCEQGHTLISSHSDQFYCAMISLSTQLSVIGAFYPLLWYIIETVFHLSGI